MSNYRILYPDFGHTPFKCPNCEVVASQLWNYFNSRMENVNHKEGNYHIGSSTCSNCNRVAFWENYTLVFPKPVLAPEPNIDMPQEAKVVFEEARQIFHGSPRAAAALLRLCIQIICKEKGLPGRNIHTDIGTLVEQGLHPTIQQSLDIVRVKGNNAVHPGTIDMSDTKEVFPLFQLVNMICEELFEKPRKAQEIFNQLPSSSKKGIEKRDGNN